MYLIPIHLEEQVLFLHKSYSLIIFEEKVYGIYEGCP